MVSNSVLVREAKSISFMALRRSSEVGMSKSNVNFAI
jgi:hypothetical protein